MALVIQNLQKATDHFLISLALAEGHVKPKPGQFYMLRCGPYSDPLLRRPFSIHGYAPMHGKNPARVDFLYRVVGRGTHLLSGMMPGDHIDLFGPLGRGFEYSHPLDYALFIAGGIGIAPLPYLAEFLVAQKNSFHSRLLFGTRKAEQIMGIERFEGLGIELSLYTEDGSMGQKGCVTDHLDEIVKTYVDKKSAAVFACGPTGMLEKVAHQCILLGIPCQVSIDRMMACGIGACQGCVVRGSSGSSTPAVVTYRRVCTDGPVFQAQEIDWGREKEEEECPR